MPKSGQNRLFHVPCDLEIWQMTLKNNKTHLLCYLKLCASFCSQSVNSNWCFSPETPNLGQNQRFFGPLWQIWRMTLKNNWATLLCYFKLCASFRSHLWIQTGVMVRKRPNWAKFALASVTLTSDLEPFAWTQHLLMVITPENFRMIRWEEHCQKGVSVMDGHLRRIWSQLPWSKLHRILASSFLSSSYRVIFVFFI